MAYQEIYSSGFKATGLNEILLKTGLSKGALYHHFDSKKGLGMAVLSELVWPEVEETWIDPVRKAETFISGLKTCFERVLKASKKDTFYGCPLFNLSQELSGVDNDFRREIHGAFTKWHQAYAEILQRDQDKGLIGPDINVAEITVFVVASIEGALGLAKAEKNDTSLKVCFQNLETFLINLQK